MIEGGLLWVSVRAILIVFFELDRFFAVHPFINVAVWVLLLAAFFLVSIQIELVKISLDRFGGQQHLESRLKVLSGD